MVSHLAAKTVGFWYGPSNVVVSVGDGHVFDDITRVQNVRARGWYFDINFASGYHLTRQTHTFEQITHVTIVYFDANLSIDEACVDNFVALLERGKDA